jgi:hypothetical protein
MEWVLGPMWQAAIFPLQLLLVMGAWCSLLRSSEIFRSLGCVNVELMMGIVALRLSSSRPGGERAWHSAVDVGDRHLRRQRGSPQP